MHRKMARIGVVGMGRSGKTLLLKTLFNGQKVRDLFECGSLLGVTVLHGLFNKSTSLRNDLCRQIAMQTKVDLDRNMKGEDAKIWLNERLQRTNDFLEAFPSLDNVRREGKLRTM